MSVSREKAQDLVQVVQSGVSLWHSTQIELARTVIEQADQIALLQAALDERDKVDEIRERDDPYDRL